MITAELGRVPLVPHHILKRLNCFEPSDDRFRAAARARQALLREAKGLPMGTWAANTDKQRELGSYLAEEHRYGTFINETVGHLAYRSVCWAEYGALYDTDRLFRNMLSSMPAVFSLLGPLALDLRLATRVMRRICPDFVHSVDAAQFETSPFRRPSKDGIGDRSAFDALFKATTADRKEGFLAIEVKYTESMLENPARHRKEYDETSIESELFVDPEHPQLRAAPLQQLWRQHMLAYTLKARGLYSAGRFIVLAPSLNRAAQDALALYRTHLLPGGIIPFDVISYEQFVDAIRRSGAREIAAQLHERYLDWEPLDSLILG